jgi:hypothetical protein
MHVVIDEVRAPRARMRAGHPERWPGLVALGAILFGLSAFAFSGWVYVEGQREIVRLSTELAQLKVSLDLYVRNGGGSADLTDLTERLTELEQAARSNAVPMPSAPANAADSAAAPTPSGEDCLPEGMRLLVAAGDSYPICGQAAEVTVSFVDNGYITLSNGTSVASGGTTPLPGSACTLAVTSGGDEGLTGYAEIRVTC